MDNTEATTADSFPGFNTASAGKYRRLREIKDIVARYLMAMGGISVIIAITLIAFYLLYVVIPIFRPAHIEQLASYAVPGDSKAGSSYFAMEEQHEIGLRVTTAGKLNFFRTSDGSVLDTFAPFEDYPAAVTAFAKGDPSQNLLAFGTADGKVLLVKHLYKTTYPEGVRLITPWLQYPLGDSPIAINENSTDEVRLLSAQSNDTETTIAALTTSGAIHLVSFARETSFLSDEVTVTRKDSTIAVDNNVTHLILDVDQRELYFADDHGFIDYYDVSNKSAPRLVQRVHAVPEKTRITSLEFLAGGISILVGDSSGRITQWFPVRDDENNYTLDQIRNFDLHQAPITGIDPEYSRKGFLAIDEKGYLGIYHTTAHRTLKIQQIADHPLQAIAIAPRANAMLLQTAAGRLEYWNVENEHPEISWQSIWGKVWYESRQQPEYIWQSSSASNDFEPKFSLTPLAFGTLKAAFYAMLFSIPLSILGAIYTAYFMSAGMRTYVKPTIEMMGALPTVILGFLAGLWLAPFIEKNLTGMFMLLLVLPVVILICSYAWRYIPSKVRQGIPDGWEAGILIPILLLAGYLALLLGHPVENVFFGGNMPLWLNNEMGISYDQRNSLVVGIAMGFAVIPTIFSISEDAIFSVPKHLTTGSLALGATPWQTIMRVVLLTASPGIFSAVMIGFGRAVGETMIVVMATGNTPIMDMNIFQGFRALSANIAVEMPESEVGSSHYRILFLAGLVLFILTFLFNTAAEVVRQRLRTKYSTL